MSASALPRKKEIHYTLFDYDSGKTLGEVQTLTVDVFTSQVAEVYCRLRDYLSYSHHMQFPETMSYECCRDDNFGKCYVAEGKWNSKKFGVMFA